MLAREPYRFASASVRRDSRLTLICLQRGMNCRGWQPGSARPLAKSETAHTTPLCTPFAVSLVRHRSRTAQITPQRPLRYSVRGLPWSARAGSPEIAPYRPRFHLSNWTPKWPSKGVVPERVFWVSESPPDGVDPIAPATGRTRLVACHQLLPAPPRADPPSRRPRADLAARARERLGRSPQSVSLQRFDRPRPDTGLVPLTVHASRPLGRSPAA